MDAYFIPVMKFLSFYYYFLFTVHIIVSNLNQFMYKTVQSSTILQKWTKLG